MRLQSAIFTLDDTLLAPAAQAEREEIEKVLSLFKMEGVWLGGVTALDDASALAALNEAGFAPHLRFVLSERVALCAADSGTMLRRAMKRLHGTKEDTAVFSASPAALMNARAEGFRTVAVRLGADESAWSARKALADEALEHFSELLG